MGHHERRLRDQGGYFCRVQHLSSVHLPTLAREALIRDQVTLRPASLRVCHLPRKNLVHLAFELPEGLGGAGWYATHHALAQLLSTGQTATVHVYVHLPAELEEVVAYADGHWVGGERLCYADVDASDEETADDALFARLQDTWPLGHLAQVFGVSRQELLALESSPDGVRLDLPD
jgi:hypothetical protein